MTVSTRNKLKLGLAKSQRRQLAAEGATAEALTEIDNHIEDLSDEPKATQKALSARRDAHTARFGTLDERFHSDGFKALKTVAVGAAENLTEFTPRSAQDKISAGLTAHRAPKPNNPKTRLDWDGTFNESSNAIQNGLDELREGA